MIGNAEGIGLVPLVPAAPAKHRTQLENKEQRKHREQNDIDYLKAAAHQCISFRNNTRDRHKQASA